MVYGGALTNGESVTFPTTTPTTTERVDIQTGATATDCTLFAGTQPVTSTGLQGTRTITATTVNAVDTSCCFAVVLKGRRVGGRRTRRSRGPPRPDPRRLPVPAGGHRWRR
jgi:hypothetical protein